MEILGTKSRRELRNITSLRDTLVTERTAAQRELETANTNLEGANINLALRGADRNTARAERDEALRQLEEAQTAVVDRDTSRKSFVRREESVTRLVRVWP